MTLTSRDALWILDLLAAVGVPAWVDGGWGVDALLGEQTREHNDIDLVIPLDDVPIARATLEARGFWTLRDWLPTALALRDDAGREVDLHPVTPTEDGGGDQAQLDSGSFHYPAPTTGCIAGRVLACVPADTQVHCHLGYQPTAKDHHDMRLLAQRLGLALPPPYDVG